MAHKTTVLKFNQWEDVYLWLCGTCLWAVSDLRLHLRTSDNNCDKQCGGSSPQRTLKLSPDGTQKKELEGASKPSTGKATLLLEPNKYVIIASFDRAQLLKVDTCQMIFLSLIRLIHFASIVLFLENGHHWNF